VPQGYFENLPEAILILVQTEEASPVLPASSQNPYSVPTGYFENLAEAILNRVKEEKVSSAKEEIEALSPVLGKLNKSNPYTLPTGYFEELATNITDGAKAIELVNEELENLSPLMMSLKNKNVYEAPETYFDTLATTILTRSKQQQPAKVVSMNFGKKIMRYAVAAVIAGLILGGWFYQNPGVDPTDPVSVIKKVSDKELQEYVENQNTVLEENTSEGIAEIDAADVKEMLADVSDEELQNYVEQTSGENNNAITN
jgi:hypothetical protein